MVVRIAILALCLTLSLGSGAASAGEKPGQKKPRALQARPWAFGQSASRKDTLWQRSVKAGELHERATPGSKPRTTDSVDTTRGIDSALKGKKQPGQNGDLGVSWQQENSNWQGNPHARPVPDEHLPLQKNHRVRAFADVDAGDDLNIRVGPELILKDRQETPYKGNSDQPDSSVGMGMQFQLGF